MAETGNNDRRTIMRAYEFSEMSQDQETPSTLDC